MKGQLQKTVFLACLILSAMPDPAASEKIQLKTQAAKFDLSATKHLLQGRIEQIVKPGATLPIELTARPKGVAAAVKDTTPTKTVIQGAVKSGSPGLRSSLPTDKVQSSEHPKFLVGTWGGQVKITSCNYYLPDPSAARFHSGEFGRVVLSIINLSGKVTIRPPTVFFSGQSYPYKELVSKLRTDTDPLSDMLIKIRATVTPDATAPATAFRFVPIGNIHTRDHSGGKWADAVVHNSVRQISENVYEQDIVAERTKDAKLFLYLENVIRFTCIGDKLLSVKIVRAKYTPQRKLQSLMVMEGL